jgi:hypothetical protein
MTKVSQGEYRRATRRAVEALRDLHLVSVEWWRQKYNEAEEEAVRANEVLTTALVTIEELKRQLLVMQGQRDLLQIEVHALRR